jgi:HlyD family secretion protein
VSFAAFPGRQYTGEIAEIDPAATLSGELALFGVSIALDDGTPNGLVNGMSASSNVVTARAPDAVYVPADAVTSEPDGTSAVLVRKGDTTTLRAVRIGVRGDQYIQITAGLKPGDRVVLAASAGSDGWPGDTFPGA